MGEPVKCSSLLNNDEEPKLHDCESFLNQFETALPVPLYFTFFLYINMRNWTGTTTQTFSFLLQKEKYHTHLAVLYLEEVLRLKADPTSSLDTLNRERFAFFCLVN